uniref:Uncharacterized protein n=1 Tax=Leptocylindrus danicus TaxID=163516 RepID=A0A7S2L8U1_9STRA|eukprot:CAMPEP_0116027922 /NCGR_PEP_ID=MMETSP0321-20121206/15024_1 /TAXON_ID=163516 /ORGANISM="Leptocylindrus danicus var. danicus, Strain B650" /LENGTH=224 /DNA_ID=CAMNT_0003501583 /DNA_START=29 /DNA_END=703 /DNA_ORIENTATION=-
MSFLLNLLPSRWGNKDSPSIDVTRIDPALRQDLSEEMKQVLEVGTEASLSPSSEPEPSTTSYAYMMKQIEEELEEATKNLKQAEEAEVFVSVRLASYKKKIEEVMSKANAPAADGDAADGELNDSNDRNLAQGDIEQVSILKGNEMGLLQQVEEKHLKLLENVIEMRRQVEALEKRKKSIEQMRDEACQFIDAVDAVDSNCPAVAEESEQSINGPERVSNNAAE